MALADQRFSNLARTTLSSGMGPLASDNTLVPAEPSKLPTTGQFYVMVGALGAEEVMLVTAGWGTGSQTVLRGQGGTQRLHDAGEPVRHGPAAQVFQMIRDEMAALASLATNSRTASFTLALTDINAVAEANSASAITATLPPNSSVPIPIGSTGELFRRGAGAFTLAAGTGVTVRSPGGLLALRAQYSSASWRKSGTDEYVIAGDLA